MELLITPDKEKDRKASKRLEDLEKRLGGSTVLMEEISVVVMENNKKRFERVYQPESTVEYKQRYGKSQDPLVESGQMRDELVTEKGVKLITPTELVFGSSSLAEGEGRGRQITMAKASLAQKGTKHQKKHKVNGLTLSARREIQGILGDYITRP